MERQDKLGSRRNFLKTAIIGGIATGTSMAALGQTTESAKPESASPCAKGHTWENPPEPIPESEIKDHVEADVVVVGAGMAGLATSHAAAEAGLKVIVLEKMKMFSARGYANGAIDTKLHKKEGVELDKERIIGELVRWANNRVQQKLIRTWAYRSGEVMDYYIDLAEAHGLIAELDPESFVSSPLFTEYRTNVHFRKAEDSGYFYEPRIATVIEEEAKKQGVDFRYRTPAKQLVKDEKTGRITAVIAKQKDGYIKVTARKAVVLCTGDYGSNKEMTDQWSPLTKKVNGNLYTPIGANVGDGINMAMWQGAEIQDGAHPPVIHCIPGVNSDIMASNLTFLHINRLGLRYENEVQTPQGTCDGIFMQPGNQAWAVFDSKYAEDHAKLKNAPFGPVVEPLGKLEESVQQKLAFKADTIEELAKAVGVPPEALKRTVSRYTELARAGKDGDFGKPSRMMYTIEKPPFYALSIFVSQLVIVGGLSVNGDSQVVDKKGAPIPGLFAIGNAAGSFFANDYPFTVPGLSHGRCLVLGRVLGQELAKA